jgi:hypothetical protein
MLAANPFDAGAPIPAGDAGEPEDALHCLSLIAL